SLRWWTAGKAGPRREIRMGGGYCSVDSPVTVLASDRAGGEVEVRWPDGSVRLVPVAAGVSEITLSP
ncbi:MAG: ASPIC/UnbV domain-containing protein, partial [Verrucomicrobia bacterium]|nr:ASPIC/UnbV domain-containing protein [Verrucomicrobiota bacterium]